ncbi:hypothetical protein ACFL4G_02730, partial [Thermodesulfobacteriota bacterium]
RHINNVDYIKAGVSMFDGIKCLCESVRPLWIFSLNQDLLVEYLAKEWRIPFQTGFHQSVIDIVVKKEDGSHLGSIPVHTLITENLIKEPLDFIKSGDFGVNLFKIHGSLDIFMAEELNKIVKLAYLDEGGESVFGLLQRLNQKLAFWGPPKATNEIMYFDKNGVLQFFRRALITGTQKYKKHLLLALPKDFIQLFRSNLNHVSHLAVVGYGLGDNHINDILQDWLEFSENRQITIVNPGTKAIPQFLAHLQKQLTVRNETASEYFSLYNDNQPSLMNEIYRNIRKRLRDRTPRSLEKL